jgi:hypothetical protein
MPSAIAGITTAEEAPRKVFTSSPPRLKISLEGTESGPNLLSGHLLLAASVSLAALSFSDPAAESRKADNPVGA